MTDQYTFSDDYFEFEKEVYEVKFAIIEALTKFDSENSIMYLKKLSGLSAKAIYRRNLREIMVIDDTTTDIKETLETMLSELKEPRNLTENIEETKQYMFIRLSLIPVCSMISTMRSHTTAAIGEANYEIDDKIQAVQKFLMDYETNVARI
ncbi:hypothetical protein CUJ83_00545 [Methanocella sp. CWC-04]|uniref:Uncharacterized protein n=1 Tax=Methanooceanicella nereidis TaxID=2052831 RepID=A0AAP2RAB9_9EURY|nr:hypothetical protein [Methanocella sp. CWC-04]